ncbi:MAG: DEAD/DEAH box helicase, partial [Actinobacteria bacterium]|nr:DEAD/DEAH box helicase [Actinomycetota bacterium]
MQLTSLPPLLRDEPGLTHAFGDPQALVAVPEAARSVVIAALSQLGGRRPLLVATPTGSDSGQLFDDLCQFLPPDDVVHFPAWETLPFERISPSVETMGKRLEVLWRLRTPERSPSIVVTSVRALLQRLGPGATTVDPVRIAPGDVLDVDDLLNTLIAFGYRREELVEHRGEVARRGAIIDVFPSTAEAPVRIDLWGDEVDRLTEFTVSDQRSTSDLTEVCIFPARELIPTDEVRARAASLIASEPWGREQWERLAEGTLFDGMESWLPWLEDDDLLITNVLPPEAKVVLVEPRRMRDRAGDLLAEEDDLARSLASTWARDAEREFPRLHAGTDRLLGAHQQMWTISSTPTGPDEPVIQASGWGPVVGDGEGLALRLKEMLVDRFRIVVAAAGEGSAQRLAALLRERGLDFTTATSGTDLTKPGGYVVVAPLHRGFALPGAKLAVIAEGDLTGRRRTHRRPRPRKRQSAGFFEDLKPGNYVVHHQHGVGHYEGMVKRTIGGIERDYLLLGYKGGDKLYVPSDQIDQLRQYVGGEAPSLHRLGGADFAKAKARVRSAVREIAQELVVLYQKRVNAAGHAFGQDTPWQHELEEAFPFAETPDQLKAIDDIKVDMERAYPMDRLLCGDVGFGKTEVAIRAAFKAIQDGKQVAVLAPTTLLATQHGNTFADRFAGFPIRVEV